MGFSGNLSQLGTLGNFVNPVTGAITYGFADRAEHVDRIGEILRDRDVQYFFHPEQDNYRFFADPAHPELDTVHRIQWVMANTDPKLFGWQIDILHNWSGPRPLPERDHAPAGHQRLGARAGAAEARDGLAHQGRIPEHRANRDLDRRPARERRRAVLPDLPAHADIHGRGHLRRGRPRRRARARAIRTPIRTRPASSTCSRT